MTQTLTHARLIGVFLLPLMMTASCKTPGIEQQSSLRDDATATAETGGTYQGPPAPEMESSGAALWNQYCVGDHNDPASIPAPNYENDEVMRAARVLSQMNPHSFALYGQINAHYKKTPAVKPSDVTPIAQEFLVYLCGEFRDRPTLVQAKTRWILNTNYLEVKDQPQIDPKKNPWLQMTAKLYRPFLMFSATYFEARRTRTLEKGKLTFGTIGNVDRAIPPVTICETKYIFSEYLDENKSFDNLAAFDTGYETFKTENCTADDTDWYYDFRGDGNFKPNSPESNGMIWHAHSIAIQCASTTQKLAAPKYPGQNLLLSDADCANYFKNPFATRWNGARAGLGAWMLHDRSHDPVFKASSRNVTVTPDWTTSPAQRPHKFIVEGNPGKLMPEWTSGWTKGDLDLIAHGGDAEGSEATQEFLYTRIRDAVDRHTDWYASGYDDLMNQKRARDQAYSPFVASSYEMAESDQFTAPCYTIPCPTENPAKYWKHYMFIFKVHKDNWFSTDKLDEGKMFNFDRTWFDETSFGTTGLAKREKAFDRLGTALENELDSILYLHHICANHRLETDTTKCDQ